MSIAVLTLFLTACGSPVGGMNTAASSNGPAISLTATPPLVAYNKTVDIKWSSPDSTSCSSSPTGINGISGTFTTPPLKATTNYTVTCVGASGSASKSILIVVAPVSIATVVAGWEAEPMRVGTVHYYCDCGTGASAGCLTGIGSNTNSGLTSTAPKQTIADAISTLNSMPSGDTVALCKGGAFNAAGQLTINTTCATGNTCRDLREYSPIGETAKPIINNATGTRLFSFTGTGGVRLLNFRMQGNWAGGTSWGFFFYRGAHDITLGNLEIDHFDLAIDNEGNAGLNDSIKLTGSTITNTAYMGYLGGGNNTDISYNYWDMNGSDSVFDHTLYIGSETLSTNFQVVGNYIHGQSSAKCLGAPIVGHMNVNGLNVSGNVVDIDPAANTGGCWGMAFDDGGYPTAISMVNARFSGNTIKNAGNVSLTVGNCPGCVIENNLIINDNPVAYTGILLPNRVARPGDAMNTRMLVRNNTVWFGPNANEGGIGIKVGGEGTGYVVANNSVHYSATVTGSSGPFNCYVYPLTLSSYTFINNNHCDSAAAYNWEQTRGSLAAWMTAAPGFDTLSFTGDPLYKAAGTDFTPATGSLLIAKGDFANGSVSDITGKARPFPPSLPSIGAYEP